VFSDNERGCDFSIVTFLADPPSSSVLQQLQILRIKGLANLMYSPSGLRLLNTDYFREQVAQYHATKETKDALRKRLIDLGEPDLE
jgi:hypothetical protein